MNSDLIKLSNDYKQNNDLDLTDEDNLEEIANNIYLVYSQFVESSDLNETKDKSIIRNLLLEKLVVIPPNYNEADIDKLTDQIKELKKIKQPEQRTPEWYTFRNNRLTASDLGTALKQNKYSSRDKLIAKKCGYEEPFITGAAIKHGVKYEDVAVNIYAGRNNVVVHEYGCLPHPKLSYFGASPDGICDYTSQNKNYIGRMLEIKCPKSRPITGIIPEHYELQVQGQLEVCELQYCDYLECSIKEYPGFLEFIDDSNETFTKTKSNMEKGVIIELYNTKTKSDKYIYLNTFNSQEDIEKWEEATISTIFQNDHIEYIGTTYWYLEKYSCVLVERDIPRFNIIKEKIKNFWDDVLKYREIGFESLITKKKIDKENKETKSKFFKKQAELTFLPDSS